jgi:hypothetical protein
MHVQFRNRGALLYTSISLSFYSGVYRFLSAKNFVRELVVGYGIELAFTLGLLFLQGLNNVGT